MPFNRQAQALRLETLKHETTAAVAEVEQRALSLVNPASGLANDYLNLFNEVVMLIEQLPSMPELMDDLLKWRPTSYREYFANSPLPGKESALQVYDQLDSAFRAAFDTVVGELDSQATGIVVQIRRHLRTRGESDPQGLAAICEKGGLALRDTLEKAVDIVNHGVEGMQRNAQARADRLLAVRIKAIKDLEDFYRTPLFPTEEEDKQ
jgi:hypothetical protein